MIGVDCSSRVNRRQVTSLSIAPHARAWLQHTTGARVLHVSDRACSLVSAAGEIVSLVLPELREGPFAIVTPLDVSFSRFIDVDSCVAVHRAMVDVGDLRIDTSTAREWNPRPRWEDAHRALLPDLTDTLLQWLRARAPSDSLAHALFKGLDFGKRPYLHSDSRLQPEIASQKALAMTRAIEPAKASIPDIAKLQTGPGNRRAVVQSSVIEAARGPIASLQAGIARGNLALCCLGACGLAGLGAGLTPAGDDFLLGAMVAIWSTHSRSEAAALAGSISEEAVWRTTSLSAAWLRSAARGEVAAPWHDLLDGMTAHSRERMLAAAERILDMGHTSGADALAGLVVGLIAVDQTTAVPLKFDL